MRDEDGAAKTKRQSMEVLPDVACSDGGVQCPMSMSTVEKMDGLQREGSSTRYLHSISKPCEKYQVQLCKEKCLDTFLYILT